MSTPRSDEGCAVQRLLLGEPLLGTAPVAAASWLAVEHPGPWPVSGLPDDLPPVARAVVEAASEQGVRPQLVRRVGARRGAGSTVLLASVRGGDRWLERRVVGDLTELADLDVAALAAGRRPGFGTEATDPVLLVCTHGKRDVCCARRGRPIAAALDALLPGLVWETNHVGGDRFAANVVTLPHGSYSGGVTAEAVPAVAQAALTGGVVLEHLRGIAGTPSVVQAAEVVVRRQLGLTGLDEVGATGRVEVVDGVHAVEVAAGAARRLVLLVSRQEQVERLTSCKGSGTVDRPHVWDLLEVTSAVAG